MGRLATLLRTAAIGALCVSSGCSLLVSLEGLADGPDDGGGGSATDAPVMADGDGDGDAAREQVDGATPTFGCDAPQNDPSLLAYYAFDDGQGMTVKDCSGHGHDGVVAGSPVWTAGMHGGALSFDGLSSCVDLGTSADLRLKTFTLAAWAQVTKYVSGGLNGHILGKSNGNPNAIGWRFATVANPNIFELKLAVDGATPFTLGSPSGQPTGAWLHVALVLVPDKRADIYVGEARVANNTTPPAIFEETTANMRIGCNGGGPKDFFTGSLDELRIYTRALSDGEIAALAR